MLKRMMTFTAALLLFATAAFAQSLAGTWKYKSPAGKVEGINMGKMANAMMNSMFNNVLKKEIGHELDSLGVNKKYCSITFSGNGFFKMPTENGFVKGSYNYNQQSGELTLTASNGHSTTGIVEIDGSKMAVLYTMEQFGDFLILITLSKYNGDIPDSAMEQIMAAQAENMAELQKMDEEMKQFGEKFKEASEDKVQNNEVSEEDVQRMIDMFGNMKMYMGIVFAK